MTEYSLSLFYAANRQYNRMQKILGTARLYWLEFLMNMKKVAFKEELKQSKKVFQVLFTINTVY